MTEEQITRLIEAVENLSRLIERVSRPPVIVTDTVDCPLVQNYMQRGYPVLVQNYAERKRLEAERH